MSHYTVGYLDESRNHREFCVEAIDSWDAKTIATQDVPFLQAHPNAIDCIQVEGSQFCSEV